MLKQIQMRKQMHVVPDYLSQDIYASWIDQAARILQLEPSGFRPVQFLSAKFLQTDIHERSTKKVQ